LKQYLQKRFRRYSVVFFRHFSIILSSSFGGIPARPLTPERSACSTLALVRGEMAEICQQQG
jgi:hypothetical protein